jgi:hypothetical protein
METAAGDREQRQARGERQAAREDRQEETGHTDHDEQPAQDVKSHADGERQRAKLR